MTGISSDGVRVDLEDGASLAFRTPRSEKAYPSCRIQKGLLLIHGTRELVEEGLGFGVPVLKFGPETVFPGSARVTRRRNGDLSMVEVVYHLDLVQRMAIGGRTLGSRAIYEVEEFLARLHRDYPPCRGPGMWFFSNLLRILSIEHKFETTASAGTVSVAYSIPRGGGRVRVSADLRGLKRDGCTEITFANEQGAGYFDRYSDSNGLVLTGRAIGTWDRVGAEEAALADVRDGITFTLRNLKGAAMFRGRELAAGRLAWSGLNYVLPGGSVSFVYDIRIGSAR